MEPSRAVDPGRIRHVRPDRARDRKERAVVVDAGDDILLIYHEMEMIRINGCQRNDLLRHFPIYKSRKMQPVNAHIQKRASRLGRIRQSSLIIITYTERK